MTVERLSGLVRIRRRTFSLKFTIFIFQAQNQRHVGFAVWGDWERGSRQSHAGEQEERSSSSCRRIYEGRKTEDGQLVERANDFGCAWNHKEGVGRWSEMKKEAREGWREEMRGEGFWVYSLLLKSKLKSLTITQHSNLQDHTIAVRFLSGCRKKTSGTWKTLLKKLAVFIIFQFKVL